MTPVGSRGGRQAGRPVESEGFRALYADRHAAMVRLAFVLTGGDPAAEELGARDSFRVHGKVDGVDHPAAYLRRAVVNACLSHGRRRGRERLALVHGGRRLEIRRRPARTSSGRATPASAAARHVVLRAARISPRPPSPRR